MKITIKQIKDKEPCSVGWDRFVDSYKGELPKTTSIKYILDSNGVEDTLWVIRNCIKGQKARKRYVAAEIAESVLHLWEDWAEEHAPQHLHAPRKAIEARKNGRMTEEIKGTANDAAHAAYYYAAVTANAAADATAAGYTANAAANAHVTDTAYTAARAAAYAARDAERTRQAKIITKYFGGE